MYLLKAVVPVLLLQFVQTLDPSIAALSGNDLLQGLIRQARAEADTERAGAEAAAQAGPAGPLDDIIDFVLAGAVPQILSRGKAALPLPDFSFSANASLGSDIRVEVAVRASGGALRDVRSLFRRGPALLRRAPAGALLLEAAAGLRELRLSYAKYSAALDAALVAAGQLQMEVSPAVLSAQVALVPPCSVQLRQLQVSQLGPVRVNVTGLPAALSGLPQLLEGVLQNPAARRKITGALAQHVAAIIARELKRLSC